MITEATDKIKDIKEHEKIKCVIWDLDNTLWEGVLLENDNVKLRENIIDIIKELDSRGILQSIASKNEYEYAMNKLIEFGIDKYFLYPQINWNTKSSSIQYIVEVLNIGINTIAFIDDQQFEQEEVNHNLPEVLCIDASEIPNIISMPEMMPRFITSDSKIRREMYICDSKRNMIEKNYSGPQEEFLASLNMVLTVEDAKVEDLQRAEELTVRTHQLNTTGYTYSYEELDEIRKSDNHKLLIAGLEDKFGTYGKIGLILIECDKEFWTLKLFLMSCRVMSRGVGSVLINHLLSLAKNANVRLRAEFVENNKNRMMYITYKFSGFKEIEKNNEITILENDMSNIQPIPDYIKLIS